MKRYMFFSIISGLLFSFAFVSCNKQPSTNGNTTGMNGTNNVDTLAMSDNKAQVVFWDNNKDYSYTDKDQFRMDVNNTLDKLDTQISVLEDRANNSSADVKADINKRIDQLKQQRHYISKRMDKIASITEDKWENFKSDINSAWDDVQNSFNQVARNGNQNRRY